MALRIQQDTGGTGPCKSTFSFSLPSFLLLSFVLFLSFILPFLPPWSFAINLYFQKLKI